MADRNGNTFLWFLLGLGVGAAVGVLYAPRSGRETREAILRGAEEGTEKIKERARQAREHASEWVEKGRDMLRQQKEQFRSAVEAGRQAYRSTTEGEPGKNT